MEKIYEGFERLKTRDDYKNFSRNLKIAQGKTADVFYTDIVNRVKLEYMGLVDEAGMVRSYSCTGKGLISTPVKFKNLVVGNNILQDISKLYSEKASDKEPNITTDQEEWVNKFNIAETVGELVFSSSYAGSLLVKGVYNAEEKEFNYYAIKRNGFFEIYNEYNPELVDGFVVFEAMDEDKVYKLEIYRKGSTEYRAVKATDDEWEEIQYPVELTDMKADGKGYINEYEGWQVGYIRSYSDYNDDLISNVREIIVQDTTTSQAFSKVANPTLQVPDSIVEYDQNNVGRVRIDDGVVIVRKDDKDIKQIQMETKASEWSVQRKNIFDNIYRTTKTNPNVFGLSENGSDNASGTSKERSMETLISLVKYKRNKAYNAIKTVLEWGYNQETDGKLEIQITGTDILELSEQEKAEIDGLKISNLIALDKYLGDSDIQEALKNMKSNILADFGITGGE